MSENIEDQENKPEECPVPVPAKRGKAKIEIKVEFDLDDASAFDLKGDGIKITNVVSN